MSANGAVDVKVDGWNELKGLKPTEALVVDDGSNDDTAYQVMRRAEEDPRIVLLRHATNLGYGKALRSGFERARYDLVFFTDTDRQFRFDEFGGLLERIRNCDMVAGFRSPRQDAWNRRLLGHLWTSCIRVLHDVELRDLNCAFKLIRRDALCSVPLKASGAFINAEIAIGLASRGYRIEQCPVRHYPRTSGRQSGANLGVIVNAVSELLLYRDHHHSSEESANASGPRNWASRMASLTKTNR